MSPTLPPKAVGGFDKILVLERDIVEIWSLSVRANDDAVADKLVSAMRPFAIETGLLAQNEFNACPSMTEIVYRRPIKCPDLVERQAMSL